MPMQPRPRAETVGPLRPRGRVCMSSMLRKADVERQMLRSVDVVEAERSAAALTASPRGTQSAGAPAALVVSNVGLPPSGGGRTDVRPRAAGGVRRTSGFTPLEGAGPTFDVWGAAANPIAAHFVPSMMLFARSREAPWKRRRTPHPKRPRATT